MSNDTPRADPPSPFEGSGCRRDVKTVRLVARALKERWPIPASLRSTLLKRMAKLANDPNASPREVNTAMKIVLEASRVNLEAIAVELQCQRQGTPWPDLGEPEIRIPFVDARYRPNGKGGTDEDRDVDEDTG
jgi:hypothetical protein